MAIAHRASLEDDLDALEQVKGLDVLAALSAGAEGDLAKLLRRIASLATGRVAKAAQHRDRTPAGGLARCVDESGGYCRHGDSCRGTLREGVHLNVGEVDGASATNDRSDSLQPLANRRADHAHGVRKRHRHPSFAMNRCAGAGACIVGEHA